MQKAAAYGLRDGEPAVRMGTVRSWSTGASGSAAAALGPFRHSLFPAAFRCLDAELEPTHAFVVRRFSFSIFSVTSPAWHARRLVFRTVLGRRLR